MHTFAARHTSISPPTIPIDLPLPLFPLPIVLAMLARFSFCSHPSLPPLPPSHTEYLDLAWCRREGFRWQEPEEAVNCLADFANLPTGIKQLKRRDLLFSHAVDILQAQLTSVRIVEVAHGVQLSLSSGHRTSVAGGSPGSSAGGGTGDGMGGGGGGDGGVSGGLIDQYGQPYAYEAAEGETLVLVCDDLLGSDGRVMTDGAGLISLDLAVHIPPIAGGQERESLEGGGQWTRGLSAPCITQMRAWLRGYLAKGTLTTAAQLRGQVIVLRREMVKVTPSTAPTIMSDADGAEVEVDEVGELHRLCKILACGTFERSGPCRSNNSLISLLEGCAARKGP